MQQAVVKILVTLVITVALAGCLSGDEPNDGGGGSTNNPYANDGGPSGDSSLLFDVSVIDDEYGMGEPGILAGRDGTLWSYGPTGFATPIGQQDPEPYTHDSGLFRSDDGGVTWSFVEPIPGYGRDACVGGGDSDMAEAPDGALFLIDLNLGNIPIDISTDGGETWTFNCNSSHRPGVDRQWVAASDEYVWITTNAFGSTTPENYDLSNPTDPAVPTGAAISYRAPRLGLGLPADGLVFEVPQEIPRGGMIIWDPTTGNLYTAGNAAQIGISTDNGDTWETRDTGLHGTDRSNSFTSVAVDQVGNVYAFGAGDDGLVLSGSQDQGATWTDAAVFAPYEGDYAFAWVAAGGDGIVNFGWYGRPAENDTSFLRQETYGYYTFAGQTVDFFANERFDRNVTATYALVDPVPVTTKELCRGIAIVYFNQEDPTHEPGPLKNCDVINPEATRALGDFFEIGVDAEGHMLITYVREIDADGNTIAMFAKQSTGTLAPPPF